MRDRSAMRVRISGTFHLRGLTLAAWAEANGFGYSAVMQVLHRFAGSEKRPQGALGRAIIEGLEAETGLVICGPDVQAAA